MSNVILIPLDLLDATDANGTTLRSALAVHNCTAIPILPDAEGNPRYGAIPLRKRLTHIAAQFGLVYDTALKIQPQDETPDQWAVRSMPELFSRFADVGTFGDSVELTMAQRQAMQKTPEYRVMNAREPAEVDQPLQELSLPAASGSGLDKLNNARNTVRGTMA